MAGRSLAQCVAPRIGRYERGAFETHVERLFDQSREYRVVGAVGEVRHQNGDWRRRRDRRCIPLRDPERTREKQQHDRRQYGSRPKGQSLLLRNGTWIPVVVKLFECVDEFRGRLIALVRPDGHAPLNDRVERGGDRRIDRPRRGRRFFRSRHQFVDGAVISHVAPPPDEKVVDDQAERVNVRTMIDGFRPRLLGRHVLNRADDAADEREGRIRSIRSAARPDSGGNRRPTRRGVRGRGRRAHRTRDPEVHDERRISPSIMMFAGFRSRWTMPASCAAARPERDLPRDVQRLADRQLLLAVEEMSPGQRLRCTAS